MTGRGQCGEGAVGEGKHDDILGEMRKEEGRKEGPLASLLPSKELCVNYEQTTPFTSSCRHTLYSYSSVAVATMTQPAGLPQRLSYRALV